MLNKVPGRITLLSFNLTFRHEGFIIVTDERKEHKPMMKCRNCTAQLLESSATYAGEQKLNKNTHKQFFYIRCPDCGQLWYCKRIMVLTDMEIKEAVQESWASEECD